MLLSSFALLHPFVVGRFYCFSSSKSMNRFGPRWLLASAHRKLLTTAGWSATKTHIRNVSKTPEFGLLVDIDGVIVRGNELIPGSKEAFHEFLTAGE